jgi:hypothetical protein
LSGREVLAVICQLPKDIDGSQGKAEIALNNGEVWKASPLPRGHFEFNCVKKNESSESVRWVKRNPGRRSDASLATAESGNKDFRFIFSVINSDPTVRKHPVIASLVSQGTSNTPTITIPDTYEAAASSGSNTTQDDGFADEESSSSERTTFKIEDDLKLLIQITGIWVALHQGMSPNFKYEEVVPSTPSPRAALGGKATPNASSPDPSTPRSNHSTLGSVKGRLQKPFLKGSPTSPSASQIQAGLIPKRSVSNASAIMGKEKAKRPTSISSKITSDFDVQEVLSPTKRAATENITSTVTIHDLSSTLTSNTLPRVRRQPETPTRAQRRTQSAYIPPNTLASDDSRVRHSVDIADVKSAITGEKQKGFRAAIRKFFKRSNRESRSA